MKRKQNPDMRCAEVTYMILHPMASVFDKNSEILILGSFPSVKSREQMFYYGHPQNRFWRVLAAVLCEKEPHSVHEKTSLLLRRHVALWDVIASCDIEGSSDSSIKNVTPNDVGSILCQTKIRKIFVNGKTAEKNYNKYIREKLSCDAVLLPSTSPANAAWTSEQLITAWRKAILGENTTGFLE